MGEARKPVVLSKVTLAGDFPEIMRQLTRPKLVVEMPPRGPAYVALVTGLLLAIPTLGLSLLWARSGWRRLQQKPPAQPNYLLDRVTSDNEKLDIVIEFLRWTQPDLDEQTKMKVELDLRSPFAEDCRTDFQQKGHRRQSRHSRLWLKMNLAMGDGRRLSISVCRGVKMTRKRKRSRSVVVDAIRLRLPDAVPARSKTPPGNLRLKTVTPEGTMVLLTAPAYLRLSKGYTVTDTLKQELVDAPRLLAACLFFFYSLQST